MRVEDDCRVEESDEKSRAVSSTGNNLVGSLASLSVTNAAEECPPRGEECGSGRSSSGGNCSSKEEQAPSVKQNLKDLRSKRDRSRGGGGGGGGKKDNDTNGYMDGALWGELPEHLHDIILAWLPLPSFFHLRCVCKRWNNIIESRSFLSICSRVPSHGPFFLMFADPFRQKIAAYDPTLHRWHLLPLSFFLSCPFFESFIVLAAAGGLLCVGGAGTQCRSLFVSNPMTRSQRKLPPMIDMKSPYVVGMVMNPQHDSYQILVAQDGEHLMSQVNPRTFQFSFYLFRHLLVLPRIDNPTFLLLVTKQANQDVGFKTLLILGGDCTVLQFINNEDLVTPVVTQKFGEKFSILKKKILCHSTGSLDQLPEGFSSLDSDPLSHIPSASSIRLLSQWLISH